ncbi:MAG: hypothetical protein IH969_02695 [Candidatus Krumholzibacteriota bacterium]|nr:hypothetical protein [Candidatus Krumholzibacteriota bacterium]
MQVISGAGSKLAPVSKGKDTVYKSKEPGFARFDITGDELWVELIDAHSVSKQTTYVFKIQP